MGTDNGDKGFIDKVSLVEKTKETFPVAHLDATTTCSTVASFCASAWSVCAENRTAGLATIGFAGVSFLFNTASVNKQFEIAELKTKLEFLKADKRALEADKRALLLISMVEQVDKRAEQQASEAKQLAEEQTNQLFAVIAQMQGAKVAQGVPPASHQSRIPLQQLNPNATRAKATTNHPLKMTPRQTNNEEEMGKVATQLEEVQMQIQNVTAAIAAITKKIEAKTQVPTEGTNEAEQGHGNYAPM